MASELRPLAPSFRRDTQNTSGHPLNVANYTVADNNVSIGLSEYRTVIAEQRTLLAFVRTALAVTAAYSANSTGAILGIVIIALGAFQYLVVQPHFLARSWRVTGSDGNSQADHHSLFRWAVLNTAAIGAVVVAIGVAAVLYKSNNAGASGTASLVSSLF